MSERSRAERRRVDKIKAIRKKKISDQYSSFLSDNSSYYDNLHLYSKNKIHCSCPICSMKTNNKGKRGSLWGKSYDPPIPELKKIEDMDEQIKEEEENNP